jgi:hypothetical protein
LYKSALAQVNRYFGDDHYNAMMYQVAEFLDIRLIYAIEDIEHLNEIQTVLRGMCTADEVAIPASTRSGHGSALGDHLRQASCGQPQQAKSPFDVEFDGYVQYAMTLGEEVGMSLDPLKFWADNATRWPILARLAARVLSIPATSSDCERLFSITGRIASSARASLASERIDKLTCLHGWLKADRAADEDRVGSGRETKVAKRSIRFATLSIALEVVPGENEEEDDDDEDVDIPEEFALLAQEEE